MDSRIRKRPVHSRHGKARTQKRGKSMEFKVMEKPDMTEEELRYFNEHDFSEDFKEALANGTAIVSNGPWEETVKEIKARKARETTKMASFRLPTWVIEGLKRNAAKGGVKYSEYAIEVLSKAAV